MLCNEDVKNPGVHQVFFPSGCTHMDPVDLHCVHSNSSLNATFIKGRPVELMLLDSSEVDITLPVTFLCTVWMPVIRSVASHIASATSINWLAMLQ